MRLQYVGQSVDLFTKTYFHLARADPKFINTGRVNKQCIRIYLDQIIKSKIPLCCSHSSFLIKFKLSNSAIN